jgi:hypothetical protein
MWKLTKHALIRIDERGYTINEILSILNGDVPTIVYPSPREESVKMYFGCVNGKFIMVPADIEKETVITARPMRKKEKEIYLNEVNDDKE